MAKYKCIEKDPVALSGNRIEFGKVYDGEEVENGKFIRIRDGKIPLDIFAYRFKKLETKIYDASKVEVSINGIKIEPEYVTGEFVKISKPFEEKETRITDPTTGAMKGSKLCQIGGTDPLATIELGKVAGFGAKKYARYNFMKGYAWSLSYDALQRHLHAFWSGENTDEESGLSHLAHAAWHCLALLSFVIRKRGTDDRPQ